MKAKKTVMNQLIVVFLICIVSQVSFADEKTEIAKCSTVKESIKRLECFDSLAKKAGLDKPTTTTGSVGAWDVRTDISKIDDSVSVFVSLNADSDISGWPRKIYRPRIVLRCKEGKAGAMIITGMTPQVESGANDSATVTLRFDKDKAINVTMDESTNKEALFFRNPAKIIKTMMDHQTLLFEFVPFNSSSATTTFNIAGLKEATKSLREACKW